jgi:hypothetical protein
MQEQANKRRRLGTYPHMVLLGLVLSRNEPRVVAVAIL